MFSKKLLTAVACLGALSASGAEPPRLVLQITVDGLRADLLERYAPNFDRGGFRYLLSEGVVYRNAYYLHANTETIVGHTTLATGATPSVHGMVGNVWYHAESGELGYNIEDPEAPLLPTRKNAAVGAQFDPAQKRARSKGRSPRGILAPTFSDTLMIATGGKGKNFGVSSKDRSAVAMAGHSGIAYWYSTDTGDFQTSSYYMDEYPEWVEDWNGERLAEELGGSAWKLLLDRENYLHRDRDDRSYEVDLKGYGVTFPHEFGEPDHPLFFTRVLVSPESDRLLADFAKTLIVEEKLGEDRITDYLSVSFSGVDAVNHFFGPGSLENEDVVLQLDQTLEDLLEFVDDEIGLDDTLIVLSADHGMPEMPEFATESGFPAGRVYSEQVLAEARRASAAWFGSEDLVKDFFRPYLYLDHEAIASAKLDVATVATTLARALERVDGVGGAVTWAEADAATAGAAAAVKANNHPARTGDVYIFQAPYWFMQERGAVAAMHGSPWAYDQHVPIIFAGMDIEPRVVDRRVHPIDVAPTLSALLSILSPASAQGVPLAEALQD